MTYREDGTVIKDIAVKSAREGLTALSCLYYTRIITGTNALFTPSFANSKNGSYLVLISIDTNKASM